MSVKASGDKEHIPIKLSFACFQEPSQGSPRQKRSKLTMEQKQEIRRNALRQLFPDEDDHRRLKDCAVSIEENERLLWERTGFKFKIEEIRDSISIQDIRDYFEFPACEPEDVKEAKKWEIQPPLEDFIAGFTERRLLIRPKV